MKRIRTSKGSIMGWAVEPWSRYEMGRVGLERGAIAAAAACSWLGASRSSKLHGRRG